MMKDFRSLASEFKIRWTEWASHLPVGQSTLNNYKPTGLASQAPITVITGLPACSPLGVVLHGSEGTPF